MKQTNRLKNELFIITNSKGKICFANKAVSELIGYEDKELIGKQIGDFFEDSKFDLPIRTKSISKQIFVIKRNKEQLLLNLSIYPLILDDQEVLIFEGHALNSTTNCETDNYYTIEQIKSDFLAKISHEIRTPITGIIGMSELLLKTGLTSLQIEYLCMLQNSAETLLSLVNDILDFSDIESGRLRLDFKKFRFMDCIDSVIDSVSISARKNGVVLLCYVDKDVPEYLIGDVNRLKRVLLNLLTNAIKFSNQGEVVLNIKNIIPDTLNNVSMRDVNFPSQNLKSFDSWYSALSSLISDCALHFSIKDSARIIPENKFERILEPFSQENDLVNKNLGGLGLSLSIGIVKLMGGNFWIEQGEGSGNVFNFTAQFGVCQEEDYALDCISNLKDLRILIADSNEMDRDNLAEIIRSFGIRPMTVQIGSSIIDEMFKAVALNKPYRILFLNAFLPEVDIFAIVSEIKKNPLFNKINIVMLYSEDIRYDHAYFREIGISDYLMKPVKKSDVFNKIVNVIHPKPQYFHSKTKIIKPFRTKQDIKDLKILLVEDNPVNQYLVMSFLINEGHKVKIAANGSEAVIAFDREEFDIILMDVQMPVMDGFEATALIRRKEAEGRRYTPIIAMTALASKGDRERCLQAGMDDYISKPIDREELFNSIYRLVEKFPQKEEKQEEILDIPTALSNLQGNKKLLREIAILFMREIQNYITAIEVAIRQKDSNKLERACHTFKGAIGNFSAKPSQRAVEKLELLAKKDDLTKAEEVLSELIHEIEKLKPYLLKIVNEEI
ncbi:MAG: response regulator [Thermodesulfovibrionales bacterium]|nr:response regulator [Thermodesulfovibrionales bacterium]